MQCKKVKRICWLFVVKVSNKSCNIWMHVAQMQMNLKAVIGTLNQKGKNLRATF